MQLAETEVVAQEQGVPPEVNDGEQVVAQETGTEQPESGEGESATPEQEEKAAKGHNRLEQRFSDLTQARDRERQRAEEAERELVQMRDQLAQQQADHPLQRHQQQKPNLADFDSIEQFEQAYGQWVQYGQNLQQQVHAEAQQRAEAQSKLQTTHASGRAKYPDFEQVVGNPSVPNLAAIAPAAFGALMESENSADIAYALAKDPAQVLAMQGMSPMQQARSIFALEQKITATPSKAPPATDPPTTVNSGDGVSVKNPDDMTTEEWMEWRWRQLQAS